MGTDSVLRQMQPTGSVRRSTWENRSKASQAEEFGAEGATAPETLRQKERGGEAPLESEPLPQVAADFAPKE